jgi:hypothetical protein
VANEDYISTGKAAQILQISRSTISRRFDSGVFRGKVNSITGERLISLGSIMAFIEKNDLPIDTSHIAHRTVVLATELTKLEDMISRVIQADHRLQLETVTQGTDALMVCSKDIPDLLVVSDDLTDIDVPRIITSLRRREELRSMKILTCLTATPDEQALDWGSDYLMRCHDGLSVEDVKLITYQALGMERRRREDSRVNRYKRQWPRHPINMRGKLGVYPISAPSELSWGSAIVKNISQGGAFISDISMSNRTLPAEPFRVLLQVDADSPIGEWGATGHFVHMQSNGSLNAGVQFDEISAQNVEKIAALDAA